MAMRCILHNASNHNANIVKQCEGRAQSRAALPSALLPDGRNLQVTLSKFAFPHCCAHV
jgi:hypothetical protein